MVGNIDLAPTLEIAQADGPVGVLDGESLLPYLRSTGTALTAPSCSRTATRRIRTRRYVYIEHHPGGGGVRWYELYDLRHDPYQLTNLIGPGDTSPAPTSPASAPRGS